MRPPADRPTPKVPPTEAQLKLATMSIPDSLAFVLSELRREIQDVKCQHNLAMGQLHKRLEDWRDDLLRVTARDIEQALLDHCDEHHRAQQNGNGHA